MWHCVMTCETYRIVYLGTDAEQAATRHSASTFIAEASTSGEAVRRAALGAGKLTVERRDALRGGPPKRQGPERKKSS